MNNQTEKDGCPVNHETREILVQKAKKEKEKEKEGHIATPSGSGGVCPVPHDSQSKFVAHAKQQASKAKEEEGCDSDKIDKAVVYNVYGEVIDPTNMMPNPNQLPFPGQKKPLSVERVQSSIPKGGTEGTWAYPSPQMFFNSLNRKGKAEDVVEDDIEVIISIHNNMNEVTWRELEFWELLFHKEACERPKLLKFRGRPDDFTPKARFNNIVRGIPLPFDRHDWTVDRCGTQVRYIIDYYYQDSDSNGNPITVDVRPALDSPGAIWDRFRMSMRDVSGQSTASSLVGEEVAKKEAAKKLAALEKKADERDLIKSEKEFNFLSSLNIGKLDAITNEMKSRCKSTHEALLSCANEMECARASAAMQVCMGSIVCPDDTKLFVDASNEESQYSAYGALSSCLERFERQAKKIKTYAQSVIDNADKK